MSLKFNPFTNKPDLVGSGGSGGGDVNGPGSSTDNAVARWDGTSGTLLQNSVVTISDTGDILANSIDLTVPVAVADGGTNISSYTAGDILYATGATTLAKLAVGSDTQVLTLSGGLPSWAASAGGGVTSVSGTANRITSTGGSTPVIDISASYVGQASITTLGTITTGVWTGTTIAVANGGTGATTLTNHGVLLGQGTSAVAATAAGSAGQVLRSGGAAADPSYSTATFPSTATSSGTVLIADGTNWVASTPTFPNASATSGKFIRSDGTNWIASTPTLPTTAGSAGKVLRSDGTNYVESTPTYPNSATGTGTILRADGTNWVASTATYPNTATAGDLIYGSASNAYSNLAIGATGGRSLITTGSLPIWNDPTKYVYFFDEMYYTATVNSSVFSINVFNSGTMVQLGTAANPGIVVFSTVATTNGGGVARMGGNGSTNWLGVLGAGTWDCTWYINLSNLSDGTDTYTTRIGISNANATAAPADGIYFSYTDTGSSANWKINCTKSGAGTTTQDSGVAVAAATWIKLRVTADAGATSIHFYINGVEASNSPLSTNIPNVGLIGPMANIVKSAGTNARTISLDYCEFLMVLNSTR